MVGRLHFAVDPKNPRNAVIADLDKAPKNASGRVEFVADFSLQRPTRGGSGAALIDVVNRGGTTALRLNRSTRPGDAADDGLLRKMGVTVMAVGWEFDVPVEERRHQDRRARGDRQRQADHRHRQRHVHAEQSRCRVYRWRPRLLSAGGSRTDRTAR